MYHREIAVWIPEVFFIRLYKIFLLGLPPLPSRKTQQWGCCEWVSCRSYCRPEAVTPHGGSVPLPASLAAPRWPLPSLAEGCFGLCSKFKCRHFIRSGTNFLCSVKKQTDKPTTKQYAVTFDNFLTSIY